MSIIVQGWQRKECPVDYGIYLPDDTYWPFEAFGAVGCKSVLNASAPMATLDIDVPLVEDANFQVYGGETSWEGCGYLALVRKPHQMLVWLLHSSESEAFRKAQIENDFVSATSSEYPFTYLWRIPIDAPQAFSVAKTKRI